MPDKMYAFQKTAQRLNLALVLVSLAISVLVVLDLPDCPSLYKSMAFLPLTYCLVCFLVLYVSRDVGSSLVHSLILAGYSIQYVVFPWFCMWTGQMSLDGYNSLMTGQIGWAVFLQCFVMVCIGIYMMLSKKKSPRPQPFCLASEKTISHKARRWLFVLFALCLALLWIYPQFLDKFRLLSYTSSSAYYSHLEASALVRQYMPVVVYTLGVWALKIAKLLAVYWIVVWIWKRCHTKKEWLGILASLLVCALSCLVTTDDKAATVFSALACMLLVCRLYFSKRKQILSLTAAVLGGLVLMVFIIVPSMKSSMAQVLSYKLNAYFAGTINVAGSLLMEDSNKLAYFFGDVLRSIPGVSHFFLWLPMSYLKFNEVLGYDTLYNSQILPMIGQGYFYFSYAGAALFPVLLIIFCKAMFNKMEASQGTFAFYTYALVFVFSFMGLFLYDLALNFYQLLNYCLPVCALFWISRSRYKVKDFVCSYPADSQKDQDEDQEQSQPKEADDEPQSNDAAKPQPLLPACCYILFQSPPLS